MKVYIAIVLFVLSTQTTYGQGSTAADYYQYQRDQQFKKYMENVSSNGLAGTLNTKFDYSIDKNAINDMVSMWDRRNGKKTVVKHAKDIWTPYPFTKIST